MKKLLFVVFILLSAAISGFIFGSPSNPTRTSVVVSTVEPTPTPINLSASKLTALVNKWRESQGMKPYIENEDLCRIAADRSDDPLDAEHSGFVAKYSSYPSALQENSFENSSEDAGLNAWLNSPPHLATLEKAYKYSCLACYKDVCIQVFSSLENGTR